MSSSQAVQTVPDVLVHNEGTIFLFCPLTNRAKTWIEEHTSSQMLSGLALVLWLNTGTPLDWHRD